MAFLEIDDVHKSFGANEVLKGVSLNVERHEVVCLIGASGSGKSTLLRCVNALETIDSGVIRIEEDTVSGTGVDLNVLRRDVGIVFQSYNLFPHMSVIENVMLAPTRIDGLPTKEARERGMGLLESVGMAEKAEAYPDMLSGGQQQRVAIVRALAMQPRVMLLDEITAALDPELVGDVLQIVRELARGWPDDAPGDPRDGLRQGGRQPGVLPRQRLHPRARIRPGHLREPPGAADPAVPEPGRAVGSALTRSPKHEVDRGG